MSNLWQIYHLLLPSSELKTHSTFPVSMSDSLVWPQPKAQPTCLQPLWGLIGRVQSCVTDRKPADLGRQYLRIFALIKASWQCFVNSRRLGSPHSTLWPRWPELQLEHIFLIYGFLMLFEMEEGAIVTCSFFPTLPPVPSSDPPPPLYSFPQASYSFIYVSPLE